MPLPLGFWKSPAGSRGKALVGEAFFVSECLNFDVLEEKFSKTAKNTIIKN